MSFLLDGLDSGLGGRVVYGGLISGFLTDLGREGSKIRLDCSITFLLDVTDAGNDNSHPMLPNFHAVKHSTCQVFNRAYCTTVQGT